MKIKSAKVYDLEVDGVETAFGRLTGSERKLELKHEDFRINIWKEEGGKVRIKLNYTIYRPNHDHDNHPSIFLEIPPGGVVEGKSLAELIIMDDSGHLELETWYKHYVWEPKKRISIHKGMEE